RADVSQDLPGFGAAFADDLAHALFVSARVEKLVGCRALVTKALVGCCALLPQLLVGFRLLLPHAPGGATPVEKVVARRSGTRPAHLEHLMVRTRVPRL